MYVIECEDYSSCTQLLVHLPHNHVSHLVSHDGVLSAEIGWILLLHKK